MTGTLLAMLAQETMPCFRQSASVSMTSLTYGSFTTMGYVYENFGPRPTY